MDTTETYIKMRLAAIPDLGRGTPAELIRDDCYFSWQTERVFIDKRGNWYYDNSGQEVQLERQDQLQEMYARYAADQLELRDVNREMVMPTFLDFSVWLNIRYEDAPFTCNPTNVFGSGEQLWLAFVMKEVHNKVWVDGKWKVVVEFGMIM